MKTLMNKFLKYINRETILYIIFGILTTAINFAVFIPLDKLGIGTLYANNVAWLCAVAFAFIVNKLYVFLSKDMTPGFIVREAFLFFAARVASLIVEDIGLYAARIIGINTIAAKVFLAIFVIVINYIFSKLFIFNKKEDGETKPFGVFMKENLAFILSFVIPVIILGGIFIGREIFPFGGQMYLKSDCYHQYAPFYKELYRKLTEGGSLTYSWEIGMGLNFTSLYAYYLASPVNLLIGLAPKGSIIEVMEIFIIIKVALSCMTCTYYLSKHFNTKNITIAAFGLFYGFSSYFAAYSWNIMWLDCMILLPLIVLGLERLVKQNKCFLYCISLALAIFSNYYIAIMLCMYLIIYFIYLIISSSHAKTDAFVAKRFLNFVLYSLIAGGFAACLLLPEIYTLSLSASGDITFPDTLSNYFSILQMLSRNVIKMYASIFDAHSPNIFFSCCVYVLLPLYFLSRNIPKREKIGKAAIVIFFLFSFNLNIPNYIWHGLHYPNSLPCRESFIFIFLLITMCFEAVMHYREYSDKQIFGSFAGAMALLIIIEQQFVGTKVFGESDKPYLFNFVYLTMFFALLYLVILVLGRRPGINKNFIIYMLFVVTIAEAAINTDATGYTITSRTNYLSDNKAIENLIQTAAAGDTSKFYRIEKIDRRTKNDAAWHGYYGVSTFSSTANAGITEFLGRLGMERSTNAYSHYGATPLTNALLSIKYFISNENIEDTKYMSLYASQTEQGSPARYLYLNNYYLPLGFMVDADFNKNLNASGNNPFAVQNSFVRSALGIEDDKDDKDNPTRLFDQISAICVGSDVEITVAEEGHVYVYCTSYVEQVSINAVNADDPTFTCSKSFSNLKHRRIIDLGTFPANTTITVSTSDEISSLQLYAYTFDEEVFEETFRELKKETFNISEFKDTYIKGSVNASKDGLMLTSINMDKGWSVYVDGKKTEWESVEKAFIAVPVSAGTHTVEFRFFPKGLAPGLMITFASTALFIALVILNLKGKKPVTEQKYE